MEEILRFVRGIMREKSVWFVPVSASTFILRNAHFDGLKMVFVGNINWPFLILTNFWLGKVSETVKSPAGLTDRDFEYGRARKRHLSTDKIPPTGNQG